MYKSFIKEMINNEVYGVLSLVIFTVVFACVLFYVFSMKKEYIGYLKDLPLDKETEDAAEISQTNKN